MGEPADHTRAHLQHYIVVGYDEVVRCLTEPQNFSNEAYKLNLGISFGRSVSTMDPPEHARYRRIFQKAFLPQTVAKWGESVVDPVVNDLMAEVPAAVARQTSSQEFTLHYPFQIVYRQLALPAEEAPTFHKLAIAQTARQLRRAARHRGVAEARRRTSRTWSRNACAIRARTWSACWPRPRSTARSCPKRS